MTISIDLENKRVVEEKKRTMWVSTLTWCIENSRAVLAELLATASLVLFGCMVCVPFNGMRHVPPMFDAFGFGFVVMFNVQIFGHISGAHMNPSVTVASVIWGTTSAVLAFAYIVAQCAGAIIGYYILSLLSPVDIIEMGTCATVPREGLSGYQAFGIEVLVTSALCLLCCCLWDPVNKNNMDSASLKFGLAVAGLSFAAGHMTGCSMNPARTLGPALWTGKWSAHYIYWVAPLLGACLSTTIYKFVWLKESVEPQERKKSQDVDLSRF